LRTFLASNFDASLNKLGYPSIHLFESGNMAHKHSNTEYGMKLTEH